VDGAVAQQEATYDDSGNTGDGKRDHRGSEDSEVVRKGTGVVDNGSHTEDLVREQGLLRESSKRQEELLEDLVSNTKVITDVMDLFMWGEHFLKVREMGRLEGWKRLRRW